MMQWPSHHMYYGVNHIGVFPFISFWAKKNKKWRNQSLLMHQYFLWVLMFCLALCRASNAQILTFLNKSSSNSSLEIKKDLQASNGVKRSGWLWYIPVLSPLKYLSTVEIPTEAHRVCVLNFKDDLMIWCADTGRRENQLCCRNWICALRFTCIRLKSGRCRR